MGACGADLQTAALSLQVERPPILGVPTAPPAVTNRLAPALVLRCLPWCQQIPGFSLHTFLLRLAKPREAFLIIFFIGETCHESFEVYTQIPIFFFLQFFFFSVKH